MAACALYRTSDCARGLRAQDVRQLTHHAKEMSPETLERLWPGMPTHRQLDVNLSGQKFLKLEYGSARASDQCLCCDIFIFSQSASESSPGSDSFVSGIVVRSRASKGEALALADAIWLEITGQDVSRYLRADALEEVGAVVSFSNSPPTDSSIAHVELSVERLDDSVVVRIHIMPP